ncbi:TetR/AcrR family transcriptional regulator [Agromyces mangrovi Wang et al. 2018]|uniref:TetR/AcrR family transcriptional regulator n=1 Tax=Agromyces mangrovi TaxID=1858653 RepID=UPI002573DCA4|nr:TetR/AcrR family transcriptional regulator [Agromyces mangrovi]BDZ64878.1 TetR family transcriptional regulator [Agromyces mangrovi]
MADRVAATTRKRGPYAKTKATRAAILDAALDVFARGGFRSGSIRDIATAVGMSEAGLLHHFPNKGALLAAVLELRDQRALDVVPKDDSDPLATLESLVGLARYNASVPGVVALYCTLSAEATDPGHPAHDYFVRRYAETVERLASAFDGCAAQGRLRNGTSPDSAARRTVALMDGLQVQWLLDPGSVDMAAEVRRFLHEVVDFTG